MKSGLRQVLIGFLIVILSGLIILGATTLSLTEHGKKAVPASTQTQEAESALAQTPTQPVVDTPTPLSPNTTPSQKATNTPAGQGDQNVVKPTETKRDHPYRSLLPLVHNNVSQASSVVAVQETPAQATPTAAIPTTAEQASEKKSKSHCTPPYGWAVYIIRPGDTLTRLSQHTGVSVARLKKVNCMGASKKLRVGKPFFIPIAPVAHIAPPLPPPFFHFFIPPRGSRSPQIIQPIVIITMPPETPTAALPSTDELPSMSKASVGRLDFSTTHLQRLFYVVI